MDKYKEKLYQEVAIGGLHCPCCNPFRGTKQLKRNKRLLSKKAKASLKTDLRREILENI